MKYRKQKIKVGDVVHLTEAHWNFTGKVVSVRGERVGYKLSNGQIAFAWARHLETVCDMPLGLLETMSLSKGIVPQMLKRAARKELKKHGIV